MAKTDSEILENYRARIKRQNKAIKENYDRVSATLPKGTIDRIKALGLTLNGAIKDSLIPYLDRAEEKAADPGDEKEGKSPDALNNVRKK